jgi:inhibitor of cysteine peptidase
MSSRSILRAVVAGAFLASAAFAGAPRAGADPAAVQGVADTVYTDPGTTIHVTAGQLFVLALPRNPGTGYSWRIAPAPNPNIATTSGSAFLAGKTGMMGAPGQQIFVCAAHAAGETTISLDDVAPGRDATVAKTVHFKVVVAKR